ncbi:hypothetical protein J9317_03865 [Metabacillus sp. KIGAM252]|uniref:YhfM-like domain-containing protein n=1 Tax=Metabacillus flavus TaxID=2823519 RepID=A0ABS5LB97_9BACI|nr:hypothetical protein [Metabacillus flavus]MBS2967911.1 hypothetical protein [Metabacillus flavus]
MRRTKPVFAIAVIFLFILCAACSEEKLIVIVQGPEHEDNRQVSDPKMVKRMKHIIDQADWKQAKVEMTSSPQYRLGFQKNKAEPVFYNVWMNADNQRLSLIQGSSYVQLSKENSVDLIELMKGKQDDIALFIVQ